MFFHILDEQRITVLDKITQVQPSSFYLAGGTSLALELGHRDSIDFDWFSSEPFDLMLGKFEEAKGYRLAGLMDIALMKLIAISQRGAKKDFIDLFALMSTGQFTWEYLFDSLYIKFQERPPNP